MFYTSGSIRLTSRCLNYLYLIQKANNRHEEQRSRLARYDACNDPYNPIKLMYKRPEIVYQKRRWELLSDWLLKRYLTVKNELDVETFRRTSTNTIINPEPIPQ